MATAGRNKTNQNIEKYHQGPVPGIDVGFRWRFRIQLSEAGVHPPPVAGISGSEKRGCESLVLAGGYEDNVDHGFEFTYTGSGGRGILLFFQIFSAFSGPKVVIIFKIIDLSGNKRTAVQSSDQTLNRYNAAIAVSCNAELNEQDGAEVYAYILIFWKFYH